MAGLWPLSSLLNYTLKILELSPELPAILSVSVSSCSRQFVLPLGFAQDVGQPAEVLVRRDVLAGAGASSVEAHAAGPGSVLRVRQ